MKYAIWLNPNPTVDPTEPFPDDPNPNVPGTEVIGMLRAHVSQQSDSGPVILSSKMYVRGVRYYSGRNMAVLNSPKDFFSPHPVIFLSTREKAYDFFQKTSLWA